METLINNLNEISLYIMGEINTQKPKCSSFTTLAKKGIIFNSGTTIETVLETIKNLPLGVTFYITNRVYTLVGYNNEKVFVKERGFIPIEKTWEWLNKGELTYTHITSKSGKKLLW